MGKVIRSYFKSENDAESTHAMLKKLAVNNVIIDEIPEQSSTTILVPLANTNSGTSAIPTLIKPIDIEKYYGESEVAARKHLLEFKVTDQDYQQALAILMDNDGFVDPSQFE
ncbi:hypothetical protein [Aquibacillus saliphilus]|uniref:hypothetical protein n=1 Tax=Aquibacillus saliphilus TaxID=1909422 RepID=UPI001CF0AB8A|nr:hypothetical protein [Aquibacillus saliphilus]